MNIPPGKPVIAAPHAAQALFGSTDSWHIMGGPTIAATTQEIVSQQRAKELERVIKGAEKGKTQEVDVGSFLLVGLLVVGVLTALFRN